MSGARPLVVLGDALLDRDVEGRVERLAPDAPVPVLDESGRRSRPGGAGLAAALAAGDGRPVTLITALARDPAGLELRSALEGAGIQVIDLGLAGRTPEKVRFRAADRALMRLDRGGRQGGQVGPCSAAACAAIRGADAALVSDYGRGVAAQPELREALEGAAAAMPVVWDPHPRGPAPVPGAAVATPNEDEVSRLQPEPSGAAVADAAARAAAVRTAWDANAVCMTRGPLGAMVVRHGAEPLAVPAPPVDGGDPCGAGDRFASRLAGALADGEGLEQAAGRAVATASAFVAAGGAGAAARAPGGLAPTAGDPVPPGLARIEAVRSAGGTVVATGGCFDLLHAGHVRTLEAARALGDCLVVCLNSDDSVRRLKGPERPLMPQEDRARVLGALACVDAVVVFDEDTPERALEALRPHVWAKGGDYRGVELPEAQTLRGWGGRVVLLPFLEGRSTTRLIEQAGLGA